MTAKLLREVGLPLMSRTGTGAEDLGQSHVREM